MEELYEGTRVGGRKVHRLMGMKTGGAMLSMSDMHTFVAGLAPHLKEVFICMANNQLDCSCCDFDNP